VHADEEDHTRPGWTGLPVEESIRMTEVIYKWRKYVHGVANIGSRTAKEQHADNGAVYRVVG